MKQLIITSTVIAMVILNTVSYAAECDNPLSSEEVARCLGIELRESDAKINLAYGELMAKLNDTDKVNLRQAQRSWIKERDSACELDTKESNRERWYQALLKDYVKTVCVTRYTRQRIAELDRMLTDISSRTRDEETPSAPVRVPPKMQWQVKTDYQLWAKNSRAKGLWYFEVNVDVGAIAGFSPSALWIGCVNKRARHTYGRLAQIRGSDTHAPIFRVGYALDLEAGKLYTRRDGIWTDGAPGSSGGIDLKLGTPYDCGMETTVLIAPLLDKGYLQPNFGEKQFTYAVPDGYRPLVEAGK